MAPIQEQRASTSRKLDSWIAAFEEWTLGLPTTSLFRKWAGIAAVSAVLERKVWVTTAEAHLYPNTYIILIGGPGIGKTKILNAVEEVWSELPSLVIAPNAVSKASLIDSLAGATRRILRPQHNPPYVEFHSLQILAAELMQLIPAQDTAFMANLNDFFDCRKDFKERLRGRDKDKEGLVIKGPQLNILAGTTPSDLNHLMPEGAWAQGFTSRMILVFSGEVVRVPLFKKRQSRDALKHNLIEDLKRIHNLYGEMSFEPAAAEAIEHWHASGGPPAPTIQRLEHYLPRRIIHLLKLCMVMSAQRSDEMIIRLEDYQEALDALLEAEAYMPDIFKSMAVGGEGIIIDDTFNFVRSIYLKENKPVAKHRIVHFLSQRVPSYKVLAVLDILIQSNLIQIAEVGTNANHKYKPVT